MRHLDPSNSCWGRFTSSLGCQLLSWSLSSGGFTCSLLCSCHFLFWWKTKITFWAFGTLLNTTLAYLAYLGYEDSSFISAAAADASAFQVTTKSALKVVPAVEPDLGKKDGKNQITRNRNVFLCYVIGATGSGKTALLRNFIQKSFTKSYSPTLKPYSVVNSTQIQGLEKYLVLMELGTNYDHEILQNKKQMGLCDLILYVYDSSDVHSFSYEANPKLLMSGLAFAPPAEVESELNQNK